MMYVVFYNTHQNDIENEPNGIIFEAADDEAAWREAYKRAFKEAGLHPSHRNPSMLLNRLRTSRQERGHRLARIEDLGDLENNDFSRQVLIETLEEYERDLAEAQERRQADTAQGGARALRATESQVRPGPKSEDPCPSNQFSDFHVPAEGPCSYCGAIKSPH